MCCSDEAVDLEDWKRSRAESGAKTVSGSADGELDSAYMSGVCIDSQQYPHKVMFLCNNVDLLVFC